MSRVLALDTATDACTLALCGEGDLRARHERLARAHNRHILGMLTDILAERSLASAVDVIACGVGPGSFTGLRVAVSVAQGLAWARDIPVHGFFGRRVGSRLIFYPAVGSDGLLNAQSLWCIRIGQPLIRHRDRPCVE